MMQIVKCKDKSCCQFRTNYLDFFPNRFLPPPVPLKSTIDGLSIAEGKFGSLFQAIFLAKHANKCFDKFCPSLQKRDKKGKTVIERRTCWKCGKYHSTIKAMTAHKRICDSGVGAGIDIDDDDDESDDDDDDDEEEEADEDYVEVEFVGDDEVYEVVYL